MVDSTNANTALASAFTEELERSGVTRAVISPGSRSTPLALALWRQAGIEVTIALDERSGSFFALGAAQATGSPVAILCTSGTAAANFHPAVAEADLSSVPLIVLTADRPPELRDIGAGQTIDQIKLYGSAVRWFAEVGNHNADDAGLLHLRSLACRATATAAGDPRPGPVHLNFPWREPLAPSPDPGAVTAESALAREGRIDRPLTEVPASTPAPSIETLDRIVAALDDSERTLIVAGRMRGTGHRLPLVRIAERLNAPVLAEPTSQLRYGPHDRSNLIDAYDRVASARDSGLAPDVVLRFGEMPTSKSLRLWLSDIEDLCQIVIDPLISWYEPTRTADLIVRAEPEELLRLLEERIEPSGTDQSFLDNWQTAGRSEGAKLRSENSANGVTAGQVHLALASSAADGELVYTASSMAIRDQEAYLDGGDTDLDFLANRGANGIDGLIASGLGAALATGRPTTIITGDLGFQHDVGSLALAASVSTPVRIVVLDNGGGAIFSRLAQKDHMEEEEFEALMTTPGGMNIAAAAGLFGIDHQRVTVPGQIPPVGDGISIIEVPVLS
ncbi:MAG: 2-succinyl-5-enolpyruvyl-6-hydroxy-3-cyclohexene-1-carboxylic-acid synthase [Thermoleophilia bacterium]|nr:2-succinyl-5-enolpyruvyl-6-hydroxy-3-cyclohexene-1-carboxylic-acid synthase [Thermoleophilia bacterium]